MRRTFRGRPVNGVSPQATRMPAMVVAMLVVLIGLLVASAYFVI